VVENQKERDHLEDLDVDGRILFKCMLEEEDGVIWTEFI
jgi:hypothetical protein